MCLNINTPVDLERAERLLQIRDQDMRPPPHSGDLAR